MLELIILQYLPRTKTQWALQGDAIVRNATNISCKFFAMSASACIATTYAALHDWNVRPAAGLGEEDLSSHQQMSKLEHE